MLYTLGGLLTMADLNGAGVNVQDALPLIPITELLSRGVGTAVAAGLALGGLISFFLCHNVYLNDASRRRRRVFWVLALIVMLGGLAAALFAVPAILGMSIIVGLAVLVMVEVFAGESGGAVACAYVPILAGFVVNATAAPHPLPNAVVRTAGQTVSGKLVTVADNRWYVHDPGGIHAVPDSQATSTTIMSAHAGGIHSTLLTWTHMPTWVGLLAVAAVGCLSWASAWRGI